MPAPIVPRRPRRARARWLMPWMTALAVLALSISPVAAAAPKLTNGSVTPTSGTLTTIFTFEVTYGSDPAKAATAVNANLSGGATSPTVPLALVTGDASNGTWRGSSQLPAGTWTVTFVATTGGPIATLALAQQVTVVGPPTPPPTPTPVVTASPLPTPAPTPFAPTPVPSGVPTASPGSAEPSTSGGSGSGEPSASGSATVSASATNSASGSPAPGGGSGGGGDVEDQLTTFLTGGVAAIGLLAAVGFAAIYADRRRNRAGAAVGAGPGRSTAFPTPSAPRARPARPRAGWEDYALDDEPIGTIEYEPPAQD